MQIVSLLSEPTTAAAVKKKGGESSECAADAAAGRIQAIRLKAMLQQQMGLKTLACTAEVIASLDRLIDESHGRGERVWRLSIQIAQRHVDRFEGGGGVEA